MVVYRKTVSYESNFTVMKCVGHVA